MLAWITPIMSGNTQEELQTAHNAATRCIRTECYRSRTEITYHDITTALTWLWMDELNEEKTALETQVRLRVLYKTSPIPRGVTEDEALATVKNMVEDLCERNWGRTILMLNTRTDAANSTKVKEWLDAQEEWISINSTPAISSQTHKVNIYKHTPFGEGSSKQVYVILNNLNTPAVLFKLSALLMLQENKFRNDTEAFAQEWLTGNGDRINNWVKAYYENYKKNRAKREREEALAALETSMQQDKTEQFREKIANVQRQIESYLDEIARLNEEMNKTKGEYLLYALENTEDKTKELRAFLESCGEKLTGLRFDSNRLYFAYRTELMYYEPELLQRYFDSTRSNCVTNASDAIKQLLKDIFINKKYKVMIESGAYIDLSNDRIAYIDPMNITHKPVIGIPNPHHRHYNCWGDNAPSITKALIDNDYIAAITIAFAAMSGINISDTAVLSKFIDSDIRYTYKNTPFLKDTETGELISVAEYERRYRDNASNETNE